MAYTSKCAGTYTGQLTFYDPVEFNRLLAEGYTVQEATSLLKGSSMAAGTAFYPLYTYSVDGETYIRVSYRLREHFGRSAGSEAVRMRGRQCTVCYDPDCPGDAVIEDKAGKAMAGDVEPGVPGRSHMKWLLIGIGILAALQLIQFIIHAVLFAR